MSGPCPSGAHCYPIFSGGYTTVPGQIIAGQPQAPQTVGVGNITGFVCSATPQGKPGEKFWSGACPGTWGPNGPFYPTGGGGSSTPAHGDCVPPNPPPPPPGKKIIWRKAQIAGPDGQYTKFICKPLYVPANSSAVSDPDCKCGKDTPTPPAQPKPPVTGPVTGPKPPTNCGPNMSSGGEASQALFGFDAGEHFEGGAVTGQFLSLPVHDGTAATSRPDWTQQPRVIRNKHGIAQLWDGSADGNVVLAPAELYDYHAYGDGTLAGANHPARISGHGLLILSGARANSEHGDRADGYLSWGYAHRNKRRPVTGIYASWDPVNRKLNWQVTDSDADNDNAGGMCINGVDIATGSGFGDVTANGSDGGDFPEADLVIVSNGNDTNIKDSQLKYAYSGDMLTLAPKTAGDRLILTTDNNGSGDSGGVAIDAGTASGTAGEIDIGANNASAVNIGRSGVPATFGDVVGTQESLGILSDRQTSNQTASATTTLANSQISVALSASTVYRVRGFIPIRTLSGAGMKVRLAGDGSLSVTNMMIGAEYRDIGTGVLGGSKVTDLTTDITAAADTTAGGLYLDGIIEVNAAGTMTVQYACNAAAGTMTVQRGGFIEFTEMS